MPNGFIQRFKGLLFTRGHNFRLVKYKVFSDNKSKVAQMAELVLDRAENSVGKGGNAGYHYFLLFPQCFKTFLFQGH